MQQCQETGDSQVGRELKAGQNARREPTDHLKHGHLSRDGAGNVTDSEGMVGNAWKLKHGPNRPPHQWPLPLTGVQVQ
jgi:hypothetical protein